MDTFKAPWKWETDHNLNGPDTKNEFLYSYLRDGQNNIIMSAEGAIRKENADLIAAAPLLLKGSCRAYNYLMNNWPKEGIPDVGILQYKGILEAGIKQAGLDLQEVISGSY